MNKGSRLLTQPPRAPWAAVAAAVLLGSCRPTPPPISVGPQGASVDKPARLAVVRMNGRRMFADIEALATDELRGRFTLSPELDEAARYIVERYRSAGIAPATEQYEVPFSITSGVRPVGEQRLTIAGPRKEVMISPQAFTPLSTSASAAVSGELVFVGYACESKPAPSPSAEGTSFPLQYDDLAAVDVRGKIALVLLGLPGLPDLKTISKALQAESSRFAEAAASLRAARDEGGMIALHRESRERLAAIVRPFMADQGLDDAFFALPEDPLAANLEVMTLLKPSIEKLARRPGPKFDLDAAGLEHKVARLIDAGAIGVIAVQGPGSLVSPEAREEDPLLDPTDASPGLRGSEVIPVVQFRWKAADRAVRIGGLKLSEVQRRIDRDFVPRSASVGVKASIETRLEPIVQDASNLAAMIPGHDLAHEIVVIGAHYDHIGVAEDGKGLCVAFSEDDGQVDTICNGADDNASGTAMVIELARQFHQRDLAPRRTLLFLHFAGEELGLLGSEAVTSNLPDRGPFRGGRVVAMINLDMVGRLGPRGLAIGGISSSTAWMPLLDRVGTMNLKIVYERAIASRSDHATFYRHQVPVLFFFTNVHSDYHQPSDHAVKINRDGLTAIGRLVGGVLAQLADGAEVPFTPPRIPEEGLSNHLPGQNPATIERRAY